MMRRWSILLVGLLTFGGEQVAYSQSAPPEALEVVAAIVQNCYELFRSPEALLITREPRPILLDVSSVVAAIQEVSETIVRPSDVEAAMRPAEYRTMTSKQAIQCEPWVRDPQQCSYRTVDDGYGIRFESLKRTPDGWEVITESYITGDERNEGQHEIQWYRTQHRLVKQSERWTEVERTTLGQS